MEEKIIAHEISALVNKINSAWNSAGQGQNGISRIEKDIMMNDLRQLYDKMFQMPVAEVAIPEKMPLIHDQEPSSMMFSFSGTIPEMDSERENGKFTGKYSGQIPDEKNADQNNFTPAIKSQAQPGIRQEMEAGQLNQKLKPLIKSTGELFPPSKTVADIYQNGRDNSLAAKMQSHRISDLKAAIGVNEKFLFIRDIFDNDLSRYNEAIDCLNKFENYYEALQFIDQLKAGKLNEDNKAAFAKLLDFSKRKFY